MADRSKKEHRSKHHHHNKRHSHTRPHGNKGMDLYSSVPDLLQGHGLVMAVGAAAFGWAMALREKHRNRKLKTELDAAKSAKPAPRVSVPRLSLPSLALAIEDDNPESYSMHTSRRLELTGELSALKGKVHTQTKDDEVLLSEQEQQLESLQSELAALADGLKQDLTARLSKEQQKHDTTLPPSATTSPSGGVTTPMESPIKQSTKKTTPQRSKLGLSPLSSMDRSASGHIPFSSVLTTEDPLTSSTTLPNPEAGATDNTESITTTACGTPQGAVDSPKALSVLESLLDNDDAASWLTGTGLTDCEDEGLMLGEEDDAGILRLGGAESASESESECEEPLQTARGGGYRVQLLGFNNPGVSGSSSSRGQKTHRELFASEKADEEEECMVTARDVMTSHSLDISTNANHQQRDIEEEEDASSSDEDESEDEDRLEDTRINLLPTPPKKPPTAASLKLVEAMAARTPPALSIPRLTLSRLSPDVHTPTQMSARGDLPRVQSGLSDGMEEILCGGGIGGLKIDSSNASTHEDDDGPIVKPLPKVPKLKLKSPSTGDLSARGPPPTFSARGGVPARPLTARRPNTARSRTPERTPNASPLGTPTQSLSPHASGAKTALSGKYSGGFSPPPIASPSLSPGTPLEKMYPTPRLVSGLLQPGQILPRVGSFGSVSGVAGLDTPSKIPKPQWSPQIKPVG